MTDPSALRLMAARLLSAADRQEQAGRRLQRSAAGLFRQWHGDAAGAALATLDRLDVDGAGAAAAYDEAARVLLACASRVEDAQAMSARAQALEQQDAAERAAATARGQFVPPYDSPLQQQSRRLAQEAAATAAEASTLAAAQLRDLATRAPVPDAPLSAADHVRAVGPAAVDAVWGSVTLVAGLSLPRLVADSDGWLAQVQALRDGAAYAAEHRGEAAAAIVGWDVLRDGRYGEWVGSALPDAVSGVLSGGVVPVSRRTADVAEELADLAEDVDDLKRVHGRDVDLPEAGGPVEPQPGARLPDGYVATILDLTPGRRRHILDGDPREVRGGRGGGHRHGTGKPNKTEFPADWSDDLIIERVMATARHPDSGFWQPRYGTFQVKARFDHVDVIVVVRPSGSIVSAFPAPGGRGVVWNP